MSITTISRPARRRVSLTVRVSVLLVLAVVLPLIITVLGSEFLLRPTLLAQTGNEMQVDANNHAQTIDSYLVARLQELEFVGQDYALQQVLAGHGAYLSQATNELTVGYHLDADYNTWTLLDVSGHVRLDYPKNTSQLRGNVYLTPEAQKSLHGTSKTFISDVYFNNATRAAVVDLYTIVTGANAKTLGYVRATLDLNELWTEVNNETNAGTQNYAMVVDGNGVRIAYTNTDTSLTTLPQALFKAIAPLSTQLQKRIQSEDLYGNSIARVTELPDAGLARALKNQPGSSVYQETPALQNEQFEVAKAQARIIPWTFVVLRPVSVITKAADQQQLYLLVIAALGTALAGFVGLFVGRGLTRPILNSVTALLDNSQSLKTLSESEQMMATEQQWIVESSQTGLQSVQYYTDAASMAAERLDKMSMDLVQNVEKFDGMHLQQRLGEIASTAQYIEKAIINQKKSSRGLASAIKITVQVNNQLVSGANSAANAATQLDEVVEQLREVAGK
ncbi:MAG TPA: cache domain-containing protein [Dictyobacter sp.]|jgi:hypothetical protein|nr:cache domain-containing protein [Dictyobacter sp.]